MIQLIFLLTLESKANFQGCGEYLFSGRFFANPTTKHLELVTNENSQSKSNFVVGKIEDLRKVRDYINHRVELKANISKEMDGMLGELEDIKNIKILPPDPLNEYKRNKFTLIKKSDCQK